ncbi:hypothetical protein S245_050867, partial [Arachis hypogaea]
WSHWRRYTRYIRRPTTHFRRGLDDMGIDDFIWRPYMGVGIPDGLEPHMFMCSTQSPLVSFECIEWHATDRLGEEIIDFHPLPVYYDWYTQQYGIHLRLSDRVPGGEIGADESQQQQEEPAGPHQGVPPQEQQEHVPAYEHHYQVPAYEHQVQMPAYAQQFQDPAYAQQFQDPAYVPQFQDPAYAQQWPTY